MMPGFTMNETTHRCMVDAVFSRKLRLRNASCGVTSSNFRGLRISQFSKSMLLTLLLAVLLDFIWGYVRMRMHAKLVLSCATPLECSTTRRGIILLISPHYTTSREGFLTWHHHSSQNISRARRHRPRRTRATLPW